ncbi:MAG: FtsX-like permease family protein [Planctomycetota bacterium]
MRLLALSLREQLRRPWLSALLALLCLLGALLAALAWEVSWHGGRMLEILLRGRDEALVVDVFPASGGNLGGIGLSRPVLSDKDVAWLRALPDVARCQVIHAVPLPATLHVRVPGLLDNSQYLSLYGIAAADIRPELREIWAAARADRPIPFQLNPQVMRYYNLGMADRYGLPRLEPSILEERTFKLVVGSDPFRQLSGAFQVEIQVRGFNEAILPWGIALPKHLTDAFLARLYPTGIPDTAAPVQARIFANDGRALATIQEAIQERGLTTGVQQSLAGAVRDLHLILRSAAVAVGGVLALVLVIAAAAQVSALVTERRRQIACYRLAGAHLGHLLVIYGGGIAGICALAAAAGAWLAGPLLPPLLAPLLLLLDLQEQSGPLHANPWRTALAAIAGICCVLLGLMPTLPLLRRNPVSLQREL